MIDDPETPSGNLPAVQPLYAAPVPFDQPGPEEAAGVLREMLDIVRDSRSDPARVSAAKLVLDRIGLPIDPDQARREAEERNDAIAEIKCLLAELAVAGSAGFCQPLTLDQDGAAQAADPAAADEG